MLIKRNSANSISRIAGQKLRLYTILEISKETVLEFYKGTAL